MSFELSAAESVKGDFAAVGGLDDSTVDITGLKAGASTKNICEMIEGIAVE